MANSRPKLFQTPIAEKGLRDEIPHSLKRDNSTLNRVSLDVGFPVQTMQPLANNGRPPLGRDMNGLLYEISSHNAWASQGSQYWFDEEYCQAIGGYPRGAILQADDGLRSFVSLIDKNFENFNTTDNVKHWKAWAGDDKITIPANPKDGAFLSYKETIIEAEGEDDEEQVIGEIIWDTPFPKEGETGDVLTKDEDGTKWLNPKEVDVFPEGYTEGQVLVAGNNNKHQWTNFPEELPKGGSYGESLTINHEGNPAWIKNTLLPDLPEYVGDGWVLQWDAKLGRPVWGPNEQKGVDNSETKDDSDYGTSSNQTATVGVPIGTSILHAGRNAPAGFLVENGVAYDREVFKDLHFEIGELYGKGDGEKTFNVPNSIGKFYKGSSVSGLNVSVLAPPDWSKKTNLTANNVNQVISEDGWVFWFAIGCYNTGLTLYINNVYVAREYGVGNAWDDQQSFLVPVKKGDLVRSNRANYFWFMPYAPFEPTSEDVISVSQAATRLPCIKAYDSVVNNDKVDVTHFEEQILIKRQVILLGTEDEPITTGKRFFVENPFPKSIVLIKPELFYQGVWGEVGFTTLSLTESVGVKASQITNDTIVVQTGNQFLLNDSSLSGNPFGTTENILAAPLRLIVIRLGDIGDYDFSTIRNETGISEEELRTYEDELIMHSTTVFPLSEEGEELDLVALNTRYEIDNPYPGYLVLCQAQILHPTFGWVDTGFIVSGTSSYGVKALQKDPDTLVLQTGTTALMTYSIHSGNPTGINNATVTNVKARILVTRLRQIEWFQEYTNENELTVEELEDQVTVQSVIMDTNFFVEADGKMGQIKVGQRYILDNPFPGYAVFCQAQIQINNQWCETGFIMGSTTAGYGVKAYQTDDQTIVLQAGSTGLTSNPNLTGNPSGSNVAPTIAPVRIIATRLGKIDYMTEYVNEENLSDDELRDLEIQTTPQLTVIFVNNLNEIKVGERYEIENPYPGSAVLCKAQIRYGENWGEAGFVMRDATTSWGVKCTQKDANTLVLQTGTTGLTVNSNLIGNPFGMTATPVSAICRLAVMKLGVCNCN